MPTAIESYRRSQAEKLRALFLEQPGQWISMTDLGREIGAWAVHSRVADVRKRFGMTIANKTETHPETRQRLSYYRYDPAPCESV
jgi:hypothetical protein